MQNFVRTAVVGAAVATLCACSIGGPSEQNAVPPSSSVRGNASSRAPGVLYVADHKGAVDLLQNGRWNKVGSITNGIDSPGQEWVDASGNLYVSNSQNVTEYAPGSSSPSFTYSGMLVAPHDVTTDVRGNVYVADAFAFFVAEYRQKSNTILASCIPGEVEIQSVAVDDKGDVFLAYFGPTSGHIIEYRGGLTGCQGTILGVTLDYPGGMAFDENNNLLICAGSSVEVVKPPYIAVSRAFGRGYQAPTSVRINKRN
ncbi:MAG: hypothetical protein JO060_03915, partial [Candidatus Eremiobacteraeota bacterium]|nr:hypothetical protein [Candidatus Eremiobacteraeota bacterium]